MLMAVSICPFFWCAIALENNAWSAMFVLSENELKNWLGGFAHAPINKINIIMLTADRKTFITLTILIFCYRSISLDLFIISANLVTNSRE